MPEKDLQQLLQTLPQRGRVQWLAVRPERRAAMIIVDSVMAEAGKGLIGDRYKSVNGKRQVTLIQAEHLPAIASLVGFSQLDPARLRRNIVVKGINLLALKDKTFQIGDAVFQGSGLAHPCSRMEEVLGPGGYNAMRGHGGITALVQKSGVIRLQDSVVYSL
ncbi:MOSC domain-containing protein [Simiduia litorea]|uniref:MOSC domain-containing protein n=1 Tax=Simiduia litorea TaxID=1435348 RepID=UPI0036F32563